MGKDITLTFKASEKFADLIGRVSFDIDKGKSEIIRCCILLGIDTVKSCPSLVHRIQIEDRIDNNIETIEL